MSKFWQNKGMLDNVELFLVIAFIFGYSLIALEYYFKVNKSAVALVLSAITWGTLFFISSDTALLTKLFSLHLSEASELILFLLGAMTLVEVIDAHGGFQVIARVIHAKSSSFTTCAVMVMAFFLSATLDNATATVVMISLIRKIVTDEQSKFYLGSLVVISANAGGAWTVIGDVTTIMLWCHNRITSLEIMKALFIPSAVCAIVALLLIQHCKKIRYKKLQEHTASETKYGARIVLIVGVVSLICVPIFKHFVGWPPFMGVLLGLGVLWTITDILHHSSDSRLHLRIPHILTRVDTSGILFFLGILLSVYSLEVGGVLDHLANVFKHYDNLPLIATLVGIVSSVIDNVPVVATILGMYDLGTFPVNHTFWNMITYCAGTGGSILIIGSASGIIFMGMEKVGFMWYIKHISLIALISFLAGMSSYLLIQKYIALLS